MLVHRKDLDVLKAFLDPWKKSSDTKLWEIDKRSIDQSHSWPDFFNFIKRAVQLSVEAIWRRNNFALKYFLKDSPSATDIN